MRAATEREGRLAFLRSERERLLTPRAVLLWLSWPMLAEDGAARVTELGRRLRSDVAGARQALGLLLEGTVTLAPVSAPSSDGGYALTGDIQVSPGGAGHCPGPASLTLDSVLPVVVAA